MSGPRWDGVSIFHLIFCTNYNYKLWTKDKSNYEKTLKDGEKKKKDKLARNLRFWVYDLAINSLEIFLPPMYLTLGATAVYNLEPPTGGIDQQQKMPQEKSTVSNQRNGETAARLMEPSQLSAV